MRDFAHKLITIREKPTQDVLPSVIFGTAGSLGRSVIRRPQFRIGLWPLMFESNPQIALGLMNVLGHHLDRYAEIQMYRLFVKLPELDDKNTYDWTTTDSQFDVDSWQLDDLDENIAISGTLTSENNTWALELEIEIDDREDDANIILKYTATTLQSLVNQLPAIATDITKEIELEAELLDIDLKTNATDDALKLLLQTQFEWQRQLLLSMWGKSWSDDELRSAFHDMLSHVDSDDNFTVWSTTNNIADATLPGYTSISTTIIDYVLERITNFYNPTASPIIANALFSLGHTRQAIALLNDVLSVEKNLNSEINWLALGQLHRGVGRYRDALTTYQSAIDANVRSPLLLRQYANILVNLDNTDLVDTFSLIDPDKYDDTTENRDLLFFEAIEAHKQALKLKPDQLPVLANQLVWQITVLDTDEEFWQDFAHLIEIDTTGVYVHDVIDEMYDLDDLEPAIKALRKASQSDDKFDVKLNLAFALIIDEQDDEAVDLLEAIQNETDKADVINEAERLLLMVDDPEFELKLTEFEQILDAGNTISNDDVDYLEELVEKVPTLTEAYTVLAKAYLAWDENETALETLMDGHDALPDDPNIITLLASVIWDSDDQQLALKYLQKGLETAPYHIPLLSLMGQYLFEEDYIDASRAYLAKAEAMAPNHPALMNAKREISKLIASGKTSDDD